MSNSPHRRTRLERTADACKVLFWKTTDEDINPRMSDNHDDDHDETEEEFNRDPGVGGSGDNRGTEESEFPKIDPGVRSPRWFERIDQTTEENRKRSMQNKNLLERVDYRTVWIARLLVALMASLLGFVIVDAIVL